MEGLKTTRLSSQGSRRSNLAYALQVMSGIALQEKSVGSFSGLAYQLTELMNL
jgi:hypothetical protein